VIHLRVSEAATLAIVEQADYYSQALDDSLAERWESSVDEAVRSLIAMPERGAHCRFSSPELAGLRWILVAGFPKHMIFYRFDPDEQTLLIVHVLHGARNLRAIFGEDDGPS
jgi:plasmid stabilization system protein ParE